jgi:hypothetical protein
LWFTLLSLPLLLIATIALTYTAISVLAYGASISLPIAGSGLIFLSSAIILICSGAMGELVYKLGDVREHRFTRLTQRVHGYGQRSGNE